jgi:hypothetical protein
MTPKQAEDLIALISAQEVSLQTLFDILRSQDNEAANALEYELLSGADPIARSLTQNIVLLFKDPVDVDVLTGHPNLDPILFGEGAWVLRSPIRATRLYEEMIDTLNKGMLYQIRSGAINLVVGDSVALSAPPPGKRLRVGRLSVSSNATLALNGGSAIALTPEDDHSIILGAEEGLTINSDTECKASLLWIEEFAS